MEFKNHFARAVRLEVFVARIRICQAKFVWSLLSALLPVGSIASGQNARDGFDPGITNTVTAIAVQADGKILVGGGFLTVAGVARTNFARLKPDGTLDGLFEPRVKAKFGGNERGALVIQVDGKILLTGSYVDQSGQSVDGLIRLDAEGAVDTAFRAAASSSFAAIQNGGKILVRSGSSVFRLNSDGSLNATIPTGVPNGNNLAVQQDGRFLVAGGSFSNDGLGNQILRRFDANGVRDPGFAPRVRWSAEVVEYTFIESLAVQPDGKVLIGGWFSFVNEQPCGDFARVNRDGSLDASFFPGPYSGFPRDILVQPDGKILVVTGAIRRHLPDGHPDPSFRFVWNGYTDAKCVALQPDGKILLGGLFTSTNGAAPKGLIRLYPDGTLDDDFLRPTVFARALAIQPDGRMLVGTIGSSFEGDFTGNFLGRFGIDGKLDGSFQPDVNTNLHAICVQTDGKISIGGQFYQVGGQARNYAARVSGVGGGLDAAFNPMMDGWVWALAQQDDGKLLAAGDFGTVGGQARRRLVRLLPGGLVDGGFTSSEFASSNCADCFLVRQAILQPDGKVVVSGAFTLSSGGGRTNLARLHSDGTLDASFRPAVSGRILALQRDGKLLIARDATALVPNQLVRLNSDGSLDPGFAAGAIGNVSAAAVQADGRIVVTAGSGNEVVLRLNSNGTEDLTFARVDDGFLFPDGIALQFDGKILVHGPFGVRRVSNPTAALQSITLESGGNELVWRRGGSSPEVERVVFERSSDGTNYALIGVGVPVAEGWRMTNAAIPSLQNNYLRARGRVSTGWNNASSSMMESVVQFYVTKLPRIIHTFRGNGPNPYLEFHFPNPEGIRYGLLATTNVSLSEYQWQRLAPPEMDIFDVEGRYYFWEVATNAARFYRLTPP